MIFYVLVLFPVIRNPDLKDQKLKILQLTGLQFRSVSYILFFIFLLSGLGILSEKGFFSQNSNSNLWFSNLGLMAISKIVLFVILVISSLVHDFVTGPKAFLHAETNQNMYERNRKISSFFGRVNLLLSVLIALLGILLSRSISLFFL
jgi:hypothetical protein